GSRGSRLKESGGLRDRVGALRDQPHLVSLAGGKRRQIPGDQQDAQLGVDVNVAARRAGQRCSEVDLASLRFLQEAERLFQTIAFGGGIREALAGGRQLALQAAGFETKP